MRKFAGKLFLASALAVSSLTAASAADLTPEPMAVPVPAPVPVPDYGGSWYLKGYVGITNQQADNFSNDVIKANAAAFTIVNHEFDSSPLIGGGIGYRHSDRFRFDLTGEYRSKASFTGLDFFTGCALGSGTCTNEYHGFKSETLLLANAYVDLGTFRGITPYVGAGIGVVNLNFDDVKDVNQIAGAIHWAGDNDEWNFAWAIHAGLAYNVSDSLTLDMGYRYVNLGDAVSGRFTNFDPSVTSPGPLTVEDIDSHDLLVGLRWNLDHGSCCQAAQAVYTPPVYRPFK
ncbi:MAG: porin family protein [Alphaproteobacteria bacterium]|nr:MAG: porin family protein [Alphaproteobacteria bacterium]